MKKKVIVVGNFNKGSLESSYLDAFIEHGFESYSFDIIKAEYKYVRFKPLGSLVNKFIPVLAWIKKANRELILLAKKINPDYILYVGQNRYLANTIAQLKSMINSKHIMIWPDTLLNLGNLHITSLPLFDCICSYSKSSVEPIKQLGGKKVIWLPLAGDQKLHNSNKFEKNFNYGISFIGQWRPERDEAISYILNNISDIDVNIWGPDWKRRATNKKIAKCIRGGALYGDDFSEVIVSSKINLNIIDDTNYPAANMRFFEIPALGGIQVCSSCPEMEDHFIDKRDLFYYKNLEGLVEIIKSIDKIKNLSQIQKNAYDKIFHQNSYYHRVNELLNNLN